MTRILMIAPTPFFSDRGCHVRIYEMARHLIKRGIDCHILTYPIGYDPPGLKIKRVPPLAGYDRTEAGPAWPRLVLDARLVLETRRALDEINPSVIHAHLHEGCLIAGAARLGKRIPVVFDYQGSLTGESLQHGFIAKDGAAARFFAAVERMIDRSADRVVVSSSTLDSGLGGLPVTPLPDGVDADAFKPGPPDLELRKRLGLPDDLPVVVYLGVMSNYQGVDVLLNAASRLIREGRRVHFLIMGYPTGEYPGLARRLSLSDHVTFTGRVNYFNAPDHLRLGTVAAAPKLAATESNGKVLNYMACGLPTAAFDLPVNREILDDRASYAAPSADREKAAATMADAIARLLDDPGLRRNLAETGRRRAIDRFSLDDQAATLSRIYEELRHDG